MQVEIKKITFSHVTMEQTRKEAHQANPSSRQRIQKMQTWKTT